MWASCLCTLHIIRSQTPTVFVDVYRFLEAMRFVASAPRSGHAGRLMDMFTAPERSLQGGWLWDIGVLNCRRFELLEPIWLT